MKKPDLKTSAILRLFLFLAIIIFVFLSCTCKRVPSDVKKLISTELITEMEKAGFAFHLGNNPPNIEGYYRLDPKNSYDNSGRFKPGDMADVTYFEFKNQVNRNLDVYVRDFAGKGSIDSSKASIIRGEGNFFTLIAQAYGQYKGAKYKYNYVISGEKTPKGIKNAQLSFVMIESEVIEEVAKAGTIRIFTDDLASYSSQ